MPTANQTVSDAENQRNFAQSAQSAGAQIGAFSHNARIDEERRFRCLELAVRLATGGEVQLARDFYNFVTGKGDENVRTTVLRALNEAGVD